MAITDATGVLLWVEGAHALRSKAEAMNFVEGARWSEDCAGTNAPGTALALDRPVQVFASEHFSRIVQPWTCSAAPIHDPFTGELLGIVDLTGGHQIGSPYARALVQATVAAAESELRLNAANDRQPSHVPDRSRPARPSTVRVRSSNRIEVLGRDDAALSGPAGTIRAQPAPRRTHAADHDPSGGLSVEQLSSHLSECESAPVTIRAEMSRLRQHIGEGFISSRPYRIAVDLTSDFEEVRSLIRRGSLRRALAAYPGPVLPRSTAPGIVEMREDLRAELRRRCSSPRKSICSSPTRRHRTDGTTSSSGSDAWLCSLRRRPAGQPLAPGCSGSKPRIRGRAACGCRPVRATRLQRRRR